MSFQTEGTVSAIMGTAHGYGDDKTLGYRATLDLPFGSATVEIPTGIPHPKLGDRFRLTLDLLTETEGTGVPEPE